MTTQTAGGLLCRLFLYSEHSRQNATITAKCKRLSNYPGQCENVARFGKYKATRA